jgi:hypothetical protein
MAALDALVVCEVGRLVIVSTIVAACVHLLSATSARLNLFECSFRDRHDDFGRRHSATKCAAAAAGPLTHLLARGSSAVLRAVLMVKQLCYDESSLEAISSSHAMAVTIMYQLGIGFVGAEPFEVFTTDRLANTSISSPPSRAWTPGVVTTVAYAASTRARSALSPPIRPRVLP